MKKILVMMATLITLFAALCIQAQAKTEFKLDENGVLWGKGDNNHHQLGFDSNGESVEDFVKITDNVKEFTGTTTIYAIKNDNSVWAWGYNGEGNCGTGNTENVKAPTKILTNALQTSFSSGSIVLDTEGKLWVWGSNTSSRLWGPSYGNIGLGNETEYISTPTVILEDVREISVGFVSASKAVFAIKNNGELFGFGREASDFGLGTTIEKVEEINNIKKVTVSGYMAIAETNNNEVYVCGSYPIGTWSATTQTRRISSKFKKIFDDVKMIVEGYDCTSICVIKNDSNLYGWGYKPNFGEKPKGDPSYLDDYTKDSIMLLENVKDAVYVKVPNMWTRLFVLTNDGDLYISRRVGIAYYGSVGLPINEIEKNCLTLAMTNVEEILPDCTVMHKNGSVWSVGNSVLEKIHTEEVKENECISPPTNDFVAAITGDGYTYENGVFYLTGECKDGIPAIDVPSGKMKTVHIGKGVTNVDAVISAFSGHANYMNVEEIIVDEENEHFSSLDGVLFNKDKSVLIKFPPFKEGEYIIPESVKEIDSRAFARSLRLISVVIPEGVSEIKEGTFSQCMQLESVTIPQSVKKIEEGAFSGGDTNIVGQHPTALKEINYKGTYAQWLKIDKGASYNYHRMNITAGGDLLERATKYFADTYILFGGKRIELTVPMYANYDRVMVPLEDICIAMGYSVEWDNTAWGVRAIKGYEQILFPVFPDNTFKGEVYDVYYIDGSGESVVTQNSYQLQSMQGGLYHEDIYHHSVLNNGKAMASVKLLEKVFGSETIFGTEDIKSKAGFISGFDDHTIAFYENAIWAWGGEYGEVPVKLFDKVKKPVADGCLTSDNKLYMWGAKAYMGIGESEGKRDNPILVMENVEDVWNTSNSYFARKTDGSMWAWGKEGYMTVLKSNGYSMESYISNQLGVGENAKHDIEYTATRMSIDDVCEMKFYSWTTFAKTDNNDLYAWGDTFDQSGFIDSNIPVKIGENVFDFSSEVMLLNNGDLLNLSGKVLLKNVYHFTTEWSGYNANMVATHTTYAYCQDGNLYKMKNGEAVLEKENTVPEGVEVKPLVIGVYVNGDVLDADTMTYIKNDRTMVPMRAIFEALGATVSWDDATKTAIGTKDRVEIINDNGVDNIYTTQDEVKITIGENVLYKNGEAIELDSVAEITNDRTMVPVRAISEAFGCTVTWNNEMKTVEIMRN